MKNYKIEHQTIDILTCNRRKSLLINVLSVKHNLMSEIGTV